MTYEPGQMTHVDCRLQTEVVKGCVRVILTLNEVREGKKDPLSFNELLEIGSEELREDASAYIFEFIKDGIQGLTTEQMQKVVEGDYSQIWASTNNYLKQCGYDPIKPVSIDPIFPSVSDE